MLTNSNTTADISFDDIRMLTRTLPPRDPRGEPTILVRSIKQFKEDMSAPQLSYPFAWGGIPVKENSAVSPDHICLIVWQREGDHSPNQYEYVERPKVQCEEAPND